MISSFLKDDALVLFICLELAHDKTTCLSKISSRRHMYLLTDKTTYLSKIPSRRPVYIVTHKTTCLGKILSRRPMYLVTSFVSIDK